MSLDLLPAATHRATAVDNRSRPSLHQSIFAFTRNLIEVGYHRCRDVIGEGTLRRFYFHRLNSGETKDETELLLPSVEAARHEAI